ncbi:MAG: aldose 1-epimerase [Proteobacteria bacterium]|nr:aldose 1-epimerase [Pseudomonadota bacterium]
MSQAPIVLEHGDLRAEIDPAYGGRLTAFWSQTPRGRIDWIVPTPPSDPQGGPKEGPNSGRDVAAPYKAGMFPLAPFSNRIKDARFSFDGAEHRLQATETGKPHAIHGHGCRVAWQVSEQRKSSAELRYRHDGTDWPAAYSVCQRFALRDGGLVVELSLDNPGEAAMPAGLGLHPFFPIRAGARLTAQFDTVWPPAKDSIPDGPRALPADLDFSGGRPLPSGLDTGFGGWNGRARIEWPGEGLALQISADAPLDHVIIFSPQGQSFFCFEPVSHPINAINGGAMHRLDGGGRFSITLVLQPVDGVVE